MKQLFHANRNMAQNKCTTLHEISLVELHVPVRLSVTTRSRRQNNYQIQLALNRLNTNNREEEPKYSDKPQTEWPRSSAHVGA